MPVGPMDPSAQAPAHVAPAAVGTIPQLLSDGECGVQPSKPCPRTRVAEPPCAECNHTKWPSPFISLYQDSTSLPRLATERRDAVRVPTCCSCAPCRQTAWAQSVSDAALVAVDLCLLLVVLPAALLYTLVAVPLVYAGVCSPACGIPGVFETSSSFSAKVSESSTAPPSSSFSSSV